MYKYVQLYTNKTTIQYAKGPPSGWGMYMYTHMHTVIAKGHSSAGAKLGGTRLWGGVEGVGWWVCHGCLLTRILRMAVIMSTLHVGRLISRLPMN